MKRHRVKLSPEDRRRLEAIAHTGGAKAQESTRARLLLAADEAGPALKDNEIALALGLTEQTIERVRKKYVTHGLEASIYRAAHRNKGVPTKVDGRVEAQIIALACGPTPNEEPRWTLSMLADRLVKLELVESISLERVRQALKKTSSSHT